MPEEVISIKNNYIVAIAACEITKYFDENYRLFVRKLQNFNGFTGHLRCQWAIQARKFWNFTFYSDHKSKCLQG